MQDKIDASSLAARSSRNIQLERDSNTTAAYTMTTTYKSTATLIVLWLITICSIGIIGLTAFLYGSATVNGAEAATLAASLVCAVLSLTYMTLHEIDVSQLRNHRHAKSSRIRTVCQQSPRFLTVCWFVTTAVAIVLALQPSICAVSARAATRPALDANLACALFRSTTICDIVMLVLCFTVLGISEFSSHASTTSLFRAQTASLPQQQFSFSIQPYTDSPTRYSLGIAGQGQREKYRDSSVSLDTDVSYLSLPGQRGRQLSSVGSYNSSFRRNNFSVLHPVVEDPTDSRPGSHDRLIVRGETSSVHASSSTLLPSIVSPRTTPSHLRPLSTYSDIPSISPTLDSRFTKRTSVHSTLTVPTILSPEYKTIALAKPHFRTALREVSSTRSQSALPIREARSSSASSHSHRHISCHSLSTPTRICPSLTHHSLPDLIDDNGSNYTTPTTTTASSSPSCSTPTPPPPSWYPKSLKHRPLTSDPAIKRLTDLASHRLSSNNLTHTHDLDLIERGSPTPIPRASRRNSLLFKLSEWPHNASAAANTTTTTTRSRGKSRRRPKNRRIWEDEATTPLALYIPLSQRQSLVGSISVVGQDEEQSEHAHGHGSETEHRHTHIYHHHHQCHQCHQRHHCNHHDTNRDFDVTTPTSKHEDYHARNAAAAAATATATVKSGIEVENACKGGLLSAAIRGDLSHVQLQNRNRD